ncbi:hypothetical protein QYM36_011098 [Artemia franciscana]|uniref:Uncharacterized protein n=1 Tax=Artemia franciscana TaxID=6661 RepID=A0AA88L0U5_ARTSF|nr:hypothetical protein QYM36_011098 [Artemia franciscana]
MNLSDSEEFELKPVSQPSVTPTPEVVVKVIEADKMQTSNDLLALVLASSKFLKTSDHPNCTTSGKPVFRFCLKVHWELLSAVALSRAT